MNDRGFAISRNRFSVHIVNCHFRFQILIVFCGSIGHLHCVRHRIPEDMQRFARGLRSPVSACKIIIVIISLPYHRGVSRLPHPGHDTGSVVPHTVQPAFIHSFVRFDIDKLRFTAIVLDSRGGAKTFGKRSVISVRCGIESRLTEVVQIPHLIARPPVFLRHKLLETFESRNYSRTYFRTESPATLRITFQPVRIFSEIESRVECSPRTATCQVAGM